MEVVVTGPARPSHGVVLLAAGALEGDVLPSSLRRSFLACHSSVQNITARLWLAEVVLLAAGALEGAFGSQRLSCSPPSRPGR